MRANEIIRCLMYNGTDNCGVATTPDEGIGEWLDHYFGEDYKPTFTPCELDFETDYVYSYGERLAMGVGECEEAPADFVLYNAKEHAYIYLYKVE